ncbi:MAG: hypothetical protein IPM18_03055 [Phycisphaerales bacterium]|nr:hypothetical protein [Phycisphaerales bacterium]
MTTHPTSSVPSLVSLLICDQVIDDKLSHKKSAIGIFNTILVPKFPTAIHQMAILASLTEINGRAELELRLVRDADNAVLFSGKGAVEAPNPLAVVDLLFAMQGIKIPDAGQFAFELLSREEILGRRRFHVRLRPGIPPGPPEQGEGAAGE